MDRRTPLEDMKMQRTEILSAASHRLRTPLATIRGATANMLASPHHLNVTEIIQALRLIDGQAEHMRQLLNELDDMTQLEAGTLDLRTQPTRVEHLLEQAREAHSQEGNGKHRIEVAPARGLPKVTADAPRVCQVLRNLIDQASEYPSWPSVIRLSASPEDTFVKISVETMKPGGPTVNPLSTTVAEMW